MVIESDTQKTPEAEPVDDSTRNLIANALGQKETMDIKAGSLVDLDREYYEDLINRDPNQKRRMPRNLDDPDYRYFTVLSLKGEKLGIIGVYNTEHDQNLTDTLVDPKYRGQKLAKQFKDLLMDELDLPFLTMTIDYDPYAPDDPTRTNVSSIRAIKKLPGVERVDDPYYDSIQKAKFVYRRQQTKESLDQDKIATR